MNKFFLVDRAEQRKLNQTTAELLFDWVLSRLSSDTETK